MSKRLICRACNTWTWQDSRGHTRCKCPPIVIKPVTPGTTGEGQG